MKNFSKLFLIPIAVGLIIAIFQYILPLINQEKKELSYRLDSSISLIDQEKTNGISIRINGEENKSIYFNRIEFVNSGQIPLKQIPIKIRLSNIDTNLKIYKRIITTEPKLEFGRIIDSVTANSISMFVDLINPKDKITLDILTNRKPEIEVYSKSEGMSFKKLEAEKKDNNKLEFWFALTGSILSTILAFIFFRKKIIKITLGGVRINFDSLKEAKSATGLKIISAFYGKNDTYIDVTNNLNEAIKDNKLSIIASNDIAGDPIHGTPKELKVVYSLGYGIETIVLKEGELLTLPTDQ